MPHHQACGLIPRGRRVPFNFLQRDLRGSLPALASHTLTVAMLLFSEPMSSFTLKTDKEEMSEKLGFP